MSQVSEVFDLFVVGGGINGIGIANDASGRGLKVGLCESHDLAGATSSASSKLIHGGLRYLEHYEFRLVKEALSEREVLLKKLPHIARAMRFRLPHRPHLRPAWMIRIGLWMYDNLGKRVTLPKSRGIRFNEQDPLKPEMKKGFEYSDAWVDDARLVILNALQARQNGATILTRTKALKADRVAENGQQLWKIQLENSQDGSERTVFAKVLVNAAGPWVGQFFDQALTLKAPRKIRMIRGSHIVVKRLHEGDHAYILQNEDRRIVFVIPWLDQFSLIGTTDVEEQGDIRKTHCSTQETEYLCEVVNKHFTQQISPADVLESFAGVRPLCEDESDDPQAITRDYTMELDAENNQPALLSVFGGKLTTYRKLAEAAVNQLKPFFPQMTGNWTAESPLPGGDFSDGIDGIKKRLIQAFPFLVEAGGDALVKRLVRQYGSLCWQLLQGASSVEDLGEHFGSGLYQREVEYLIDQEWAVEAEDILWRRTRLKMNLTQQQQAHLTSWLQQRIPVSDRSQEAI